MHPIVVVDRVRVDFFIFYDHGVYVVDVVFVVICVRKSDLRADLFPIMSYC